MQSNKREKKKTGAFNFIQEGTFQKRGEILRKKQAMEEIDQLQSAKEETKNESLIGIDQTMKIETSS